MVIIFLLWITEAQGEKKERRKKREKKRKKSHSGKIPCESNEVKQKQTKYCLRWEMYNPECWKLLCVACETPVIELVGLDSTKKEWAKSNMIKH